MKQGGLRLPDLELCWEIYQQALKIIMLKYKSTTEDLVGISGGLNVFGFRLSSVIIRLGHRTLDHTSVMLVGRSTWSGLWLSLTGSVSVQCIRTSLV